MSKENLDLFLRLASVMINQKFKTSPPTELQLEGEAKDFRAALSEKLPISDKEFERVLKELKASMIVIMSDGVFISAQDTSHQSWLPAARSDISFFYWNRYKKYLEDVKGWNTRVTTKLDIVTDEILDLLGDPRDLDKKFQRRGLILGDVQSGKTANYTALCNKATDCGYKVIIILAGMMENLRVQTQERLDAEFAGRKSKYQLDPTADQEIKNNPFGVGRIPPNDINKRIACFTSVNTDFNSTILKSNDLTLRTINEAAIFVVKKNKNILKNLHSWLLSNNADLNNKIDLPLLFIDDEADNASVNTNKEDQDPTAINAAIRDILDSFYNVSYVGITATPFANIFINPDNLEGKTDDLFPRDFIYALPTPSDYIGADAIFGNGNEDSSMIRSNADYSSAIIRIKNIEMNDYFPFKHKKAMEVNDLPPSMYEAIGYFMLANAIRDIRGDVTEHRSMLINVTRYTNTQLRITELINEWIVVVRSELGNFSKLSSKKTSRIQSIQFLHKIWDQYKFANMAKMEWDEVLSKYLHRAVAPIEVRTVNQQSGPGSLDYFAHSKTGFRVIAVGGNSLSRGLTLEGLCVSYFYRNSIMYDTLLQMGRWFGYRRNYEDVFKIWMAEEALDWYGFITDATNELKLEIHRMKALNQTPAEFGLKVRQDPNSLIVTARNKMRSAKLLTIPINVAGKLVETPRLKADAKILKSNEEIFRKFVATLDKYGVEKEISSNAKFWSGIPKEQVSSLVRGFDTHPWQLAFQSLALADYIDESDDLELWDVAMPQGLSKKTIEFDGAIKKFEIFPAERVISNDGQMIRISGTKVKVGAGLSTKIGLTDEEIKRANERFEALFPNDLGRNKSDSTYLIENRKPILMLHVIKCKQLIGENEQKLSPEYIYALGLGFPSNGKKTRTARYVVNVNELKNWDSYSLDGEEDDDELS